MSYYTAIKKLAKESGQKVTDLICMTPSNDPFYGPDRPSGKQMAAWITKLYEEWSERTGYNVLHVRRLHYYLQALGTVTRPNGTPYLNTSACWGYLVASVKYARYLGAIKMGSIEDKKNVLNENAHYWGDETMTDHEISADGVAEVISKEYNLINQHNHQPYHRELWVEKDTMNDIIDPIAVKYGVDVVVGEGEISLTMVSELFQRIARLDKPVRIFYISDLDPKGIDMPISVSRKIEWFTRSYKTNSGDPFDVKLQHLMLTKEQCEEFELPRTPIKKGSGTGAGAKAYDTLTKRFQETYGRGATELDALEALHPGEMTKILEEAIEPYWDPEVAREIRGFNRNLIQTIHEAIMEQEEKLREALGDIDISEAETLFEDFEIPEVEVQEVDESGWIFDSSRNYSEQLLEYKAKQAR